MVNLSYKRSTESYRCGKEGHIAKERSDDPNCMFCKKADIEDKKHIAGGAKSPTFKAAPSKIK